MKRWWPNKLIRESNFGHKKRRKEESDLKPLFNIIKKRDTFACANWSECDLDSSVLQLLYIVVLDRISRK